MTLLDAGMTKIDVIAVEINNFLSPVNTFVVAFFVGVAMPVMILLPVDVVAALLFNIICPANNNSGKVNVVSERFQ